MKRRCIGIDPQCRTLAICILSNELNIIKVCEYQFVTRKNFKKAQDWMDEINSGIKKVTQEFKETDYIFIEQQRGRLNSMIEMCLYVNCKNITKNVFIVHPMTWKKVTGQSFTGNNAKNKKVVLETTMDIIKDEDLTQINPKHLHDICDAYRISQYGVLISK